MANSGTPSKERRAAPRSKVHLDCHFSFDGIEYEAVIRDISLLGAFLRSTFVPPHDATVSVKLEATSAEEPLILEADVVRRDCTNGDQGTGGAFAITFSHNSPGLLRLIDKLMTPQV